MIWPAKSYHFYGDKIRTLRFQTSMGDTLSIPLGRYVHYKGTAYDVVELGVLEASEQNVAIYRNAEQPTKLWVRPINEFAEELEIGGVRRKRFELVGTTRDFDYRSSINQEKTASLLSYFSEYQRLLELEFQNKTNAEVYELAFSRLLKPDTYRLLSCQEVDGRSHPIMIGTDERDLFIPPIIEACKGLEDCKNVFDIGCGDGQTTKYFAPYFSQSVAISYLDPSKKYLEKYKKAIFENSKFQTGVEYNVGISEFLKKVDHSSPTHKYDAVLAIHMIYFVEDLALFLNHVLDSLNTGGITAIVFADESLGYTGRMVQSFLSRHEPMSLQPFTDSVAQRHDMFGITDGGSEADKCAQALKKKLGREDFAVAYCEYQDSRLYGDDIGDIIALGLITALSAADNHSISTRIDHISRDLFERPEHYDLCVEKSGARTRMLSVKEPQITLILQKL